MGLILLMAFILFYCLGSNSMYTFKNDDLSGEKKGEREIEIISRLFVPR